MAEAIAGFDWSRTPLGPSAGWPQSLTAAVRLMLGSRYPMFVWWGPQLVQIYNDAYAPVLGNRHPGALGRPAAQVWAEIWDVVGPQARSVLNEGASTWNERVLLVMQRMGFTEETYFTFSYSPAYDDAGAVGGVFCTCTEDTHRVLGERRLQSLRALSGATLEAHTAEQACVAAAGALGGNPRDLPFVLLYLLREDGSAQLAAQAGIAAGQACSPLRVAAADADAPWPFAAVKAAQAPLVVDGLAALCPVPAAEWPEPVQQAVVLPLAAQNEDGLAGFMVAAVSPRRPLDADYRDYLALAAQQIASAIADARAFESERRRAEALAEIDRAKTSFFSNISHELRTPLTLMLGPLADVLDSPRLGDDDRELLGLAQRNGRRLRRLVNALLDFSRMEAGRLQAHYQPLDLPAFTAELASMFRAAAQRAGLELTIDCPRLPQAVFVDRGMWEKIVFNLLSNALKYTLHGGVQVRMRGDDGCALLTVSDSGIGIPEAAQPRLFERFFRVPGAQGRSIEGSGIGLALVAELTRLHGGSVAVHSREGEGSRFEVRIPFGTAHLPPEQVGPAGAALGLGADAVVDEAQGWLPDTLFDGLDDTAAGTGALPAPPAGEADIAEGVALAPADRATVLVVDDNSDMRGYLMRLLGREHAVLGAADGGQALQLARSHRPDLVLSDVMMPVLDGMALLQALRRDEATAALPVVLLSARAGDEARLEALEAGADDYLVKPFHARELLVRVSGMLALGRVRRDAMRREQALRGQLQDVLESITEGFVALDADWRFSYVNAAAERVFGMRREAILGRGLLQVFPEVAGTAFERTYRRAMAERVALTVDAPYEPLGAWIEVNVYPVSGGGLALYFRDVQQSRQIERALREGEAQQRFLAELGLVQQDLADPDALLAAGARMLCQHLQADRVAWALIDEGETHAQVRGCHQREGMPAFPRRLRMSEVNREQARAFALGLPFVVNDTDADSRVAPQRLAYRLAGIGADLAVGVLKQGRLVGGLAVHQRTPRVWRESEVALVQAVAARGWDALERAHTQRLQRRSEQRFRELAEAMPQIVYVARNDGSVEYVNRRWWEYTGRRSAEVDEVAAATHPDDIGPLQERWRRALEEGAPLVAEFRLRGAADGAYRWYLTRAVPVRDEQGRVSRWYGTSTDIDAQKRNAEELAQAHASLQQADRRKDQFIATLAHELRNPLAPLRNAVRLLELSQAGALPREKAAGVNALMQRQIDQLVRLVDDLLEVSRITSGKIELKRRTLPLHEVLAAAVETSRPLLEAAGHRLELRGTDDPGLRVDADPVRLAQVFSNLLNNAAKYTEPGGCIEVLARRDGEQVQVSVRDNGLGLAPEMLEEIFEPFVQADRSAARQQGGLGIGLSLVKSLVALHGGSVDAHSAGAGRGSEFTVRLPLAAGDGGAQAGPGARAAPARTANARVLVVDDNRDAADSLADLLALLGAEVQVAYDGGAALQAALARPPQLVLLDLGMPGMDGYEVARALRGQPAGGDLTIVALTGWGQAEDRLRTQRAGFDRHLVKPVELEALQPLLEELGEG